MTIRKEIKQKVEGLIRKGKLKEVFEVLNQEPLSADIQGVLAIIESEYSILAREELKGTIGFEEKQIRRSRINDKLIQLLQGTTLRKKTKRNWIIIGLISLLLPLAFFIFKWSNKSSEIIVEEAYQCPDYPKGYKNRVLIVPFHNLGEKKTDPAKMLREDINELSSKKKLFTIAKKGLFKDITTKDDAKALGEKCSANIVVWGDYSLTDSLHVIVRYHFLEHPEWSNLSKKVTIDDVTAIQNDDIFKDLKEYIMSLCSVIAFMNNDKETTSKWLDKIKHKDEMDDKLLEEIKNL